MLCVLFSCGTKYIKYDKEADLRKNDEFDKAVVVKTVDEEKSVDIQKVPKIESKSEKIKFKNTQVLPTPNNVKNEKKLDLKKISKPKVREPQIEDTVGFEMGSRRPIKDPFAIGEKIVHSVSYFGAEAGQLTLTTKPMIDVNGRLSYSFEIGLKTSRLFSNFYSVDNIAETFLDYEDLVPHVFKYKARESGKLIQANSYFDNKNHKAQFWEKKYTEKDGEEVKKINWDIQPYSQNIYSGIFYMRVFEYQVGKEYAFRVAENEQNYVFKGKAVLKEKIKTDVGEFSATKIKAEVVSRGALTQSGDMFIWVSDDDKKIILRIEAEIKIGKLVSEIIEYDSGKK